MHYCKEGKIIPILLHSYVIKNAYNSDVSFEVKLQAYFQTFHLLDISCEPKHIYKHISQAAFSMKWYFKKPV